MGREVFDQQRERIEQAAHVLGDLVLLFLMWAYKKSRNDVLSEWFARPVVFVSDVARSVDFYVNQLGFTRSWCYEEKGEPIVAQVDRESCALILSSQWPHKVGNGLIFISLDVDVLRTVRAELEGKGVDVKDGYWGYPLMIVHDLYGNELYFNYPNEGGSQSGDRP